MTKKNTFSIIILMLFMIFGSIQVFATESKSNVTYEQEIINDSSKECEVYVSVPYEYSETIPKETITPTPKPSKNVQTGDENNIFPYVILGVFSGIGMGFLFKKRNH